jgi:hypothetical protein
LLSISNKYCLSFFQWCFHLALLCCWVALVRGLFAFKVQRQSTLWQDPESSRGTHHDKRGLAFCQKLHDEKEHAASVLFVSARHLLPESAWQSVTWNRTILDPAYNKYRVPSQRTINGRGTCLPLRIIITCRRHVVGIGLFLRLVPEKIRSLFVGESITICFAKQ